METLHDKFRPKAFDEVVGQKTVVKSLAKAIEEGLSHAILFTGPSGVGKTTLARICIAHLGCQPMDVNEIDAATHTGVDDMREVTSTLRYKPIGDGAVKAILVDECHMLSKSAWNSLLKVLEEPPDWVYWFLCTTEPTKVPATVKTRCLSYTLKEVGVPDLTDLLEEVNGQENLTDSDKIIQLCAKEAGGSPRQALSNLAVCSAAGSLAEARELLRTADGSPEAIALARALFSKSPSWKETRDILKDINDVNPESIRHVVRAYATKVAVSSGSGWALQVLDAFSEPCNPQDGISPIVLACGRVFLGEEE